MKVIYHIDETDRWPLVLGNVKNMNAYYKRGEGELHDQVLAIQRRWRICVIITGT